MTLPARRSRRRHRATAARQALRPCEAELLQHTRGHWQPRIHPVTTRAALRAAGVPPDVAAVLCRRLRLIAEQEAD